MILGSFLGSVTLLLPVYVKYANISTDVRDKGFIYLIELRSWGDNFEKYVSKVLISGRNLEIHWLSVVEHVVIHRSKTVMDGSIVLDSFAIVKQSFHVWHYSKYYDFVIKRREGFGCERYFSSVCKRRKWQFVFWQWIY